MAQCVCTWPLWQPGTMVIKLIGYNLASFLFLSINCFMNVFLIANGSIVSYLNFQYFLTLVFITFLISMIYILN